MRNLVATGAAGPDGTTLNVAAPFSASGGEVPDGAFHGKSMPTAIKLYLEIVHGKKTPREIADGLKKGGLESTSKYFDKIVYATLDRMRKAGDVVKIGTAWGLPAWYPALMRAGVAETNQSSKRIREPRKASPTQEQPKLFSGADGGANNAKPTLKTKRMKSEPGPGDMIDSFLRDTPGPHSAEEIQSVARIKNLKVTTMLLGQLIKKGNVKKTEDA